MAPVSISWSSKAGYGCGARRGDTEGVGNGDEACKLYSEVARFNFNSIGFALVGTDARSRADAT